MTDGEDSYYANNQILAVAQERKPENVEVSTIGVGKYYNQYLLKMLAKQGNGSFNGVTNPTDFSKIFLEGISSLLVQKLKVDIYYDEELMFSSFDGGHSFKNTKGEKTSVQIGNVFTYSNEISFVDMKITKPLKEAKSIKVQISYYDMLRKENVSYTKNINIVWSKKQNPTYLLDPEELKLYGISTLNIALKNMAKANEKKDYETAYFVLKEGKEQVATMFESNLPVEINELLSEVDRYMILIKQIQKNK